MVECWKIIKKKLIETDDLSKTLSKTLSDLHIALINLKIVSANSGEKGHTSGITPIADYIESILNNTNKKLIIHKSGNSEISKNVSILDDFFENYK
ncbi:hypothetical protein [Clostridium tagluense]|uniref:Uncharacterized protein n=1 Tax=Clostridium tagluense TaxID=360422 RepID=A0A401UQG4_9CLOT|nr:hypothetical protein [Clostridium tagluense]GCD11751.1 hypothetical protein Ctaglu_33740 [Clostridium tagluense]